MKLDQVPWFLNAFGGPIDPLRWLPAALVHVAWKDVLIAIALFYSLAFVVEGRVSWKWFVPLLLAAVAADGLLLGIAGRWCPVVVARCGLVGINAFLAGLLAIWAPFNKITYIRWFFGVRGEVTWPIIYVFLLTMLWGVVRPALIGLPVPAVVLMGLGMPLLGVITASLLVQTRAVNCSGMDFYSWLKLRHLPKAERERIWNERELEACRLAAEQWQGQGSSATPSGVRPAPPRPASLGASQPVSLGGLSARPAAAQPQAPAQPAVDTSALRTALDQALAKGSTALVDSAYERLRQADGTWVPPFQMIDRLAKSHYKHERFDQALRCAEDLIRFYPQQADDARLIAAAVLITSRNAPGRGIEHLDALDLEALKEARRDRARQLRAEALAKMGSGVYELA